MDPKGQPEFQRVNHIVGKTTLYDMEIDVSKFRKAKRLVKSRIIAKI